MIKEHFKSDFNNLGEALNRLGEALKEPVDENRYIIDATIQRFEFCIELFWKNFKNMAENEGKEVLSPKQALINAFQMKWIDDEQLWLNMLIDRNLTSHTYKKYYADKIYGNIKSYYPTLCTTYKKLSNLLIK